MIAGQQVTDTLRLSRPLGQGAMGSVWVADHLTLRTQVAVKFISPAHAQNGDVVERFRREATAAAQIKSPHVAQVFDHGVTSDGAPYIVMELLEGEDLKRHMQRLGALPPVEVARIVSQVAKALGRAHQLGIVHRDIKPDNLFLIDLDGEPFVKVLDFGVAKHIIEGELGMTSTGSVLGTPLYMSPEQFMSSKHVDQRADLWGLGVVAYHAMTGQLPFQAESFGALSVALHNGVFAPPSQVRPGLSRAIDAWMHRALQTNPEARFRSAKEMAEALDVAVFGAPRASFLSSGEITATARLPGAEQPAQPAQPGSMNTGSGPGAPGVVRDAPSGPPGRTLGGMATTGIGAKRRAPVVGIAGAAIAAVALIGAGAYWAASGRAPGDPTALMASTPAAAPSASAAEPSASAAADAAVAAPAGSATVAETMPVASATAVAPAASSASAGAAPAAAPAAKATSAPRPTPDPSSPAGPSSAPAKPPRKPVSKDTIGF
ncbi:serine/threonine-protein kinase [Sorangium sp. So ce1182]|uniref:serine/threonine-protein kinase n=1 Tax=Sorangium sp. So ce1182 TaxID=3133334 RepID=UPI003F5DA7D8